MRVKEYTLSLYKEMESKLQEIASNANDSLQLSRGSSVVILQYLSKLKEYVTNYTFSKQEEIDFFKILKPKFLSKLIYHQKIFNIQSHRPLSTTAEIKEYYLNELSRIKDFFKKTDEFVIYYRSEATSFDEIYFLRKEPDCWLLLTFEGVETDMNFTTIYDHKVSKIIAYELLSEFLTSSMAKMEIQRDLGEGQNFNNQNPINWTSSKVSLVELLYALQSAGSCNNGTIDLKQLANHFEHIFNIDLGNYYRVFQEMRIRKINRTTFLDQLKVRLIQRMDEADENPKFK